MTYSSMKGIIMPTYKDIQQAVKISSNFVPKTCWIAHVLSDHGVIKREAPNRIDPNNREHPCPPDKRIAIEDALRRLKMI